MIEVRVKASNALSSCRYTVGEAYTNVQTEWNHVKAHAMRVGYSAKVIVRNTRTGDTMAGNVYDR